MSAFASHDSATKQSAGDAITAEEIAETGGKASEAVAQDATIGSPFANLGATLDSGGHALFTERLGPHRALDLIYTAELMTGAEAVAAGLFSRAVPAEELMEFTMQRVSKVARGATQSYLASKELVAQVRDNRVGLWESMAAENKAQAACAPRTTTRRASRPASRSASRSSRDGAERLGRSRATVSRAAVGLCCAYLGGRSDAVSTSVPRKDHGKRLSVSFRGADVSRDGFPRALR